MSADISTLIAGCSFSLSASACRLSAWLTKFRIGPTATTAPKPSRAKRTLDRPPP